MNLKFYAWLHWSEIFWRVVHMWTICPTAVAKKQIRRDCSGFCRVWVSWLLMHREALLSTPVSGMPGDTSLWGWKDCSLSWQLKGVNTCRPRLGLYLKKIAKEKKSAFGCPLLLWQRRHVEWKSQVAGFLWEPDFQLLRCREEGEGAGV